MAIRLWLAWKSVLRTRISETKEEAVLPSFLTTPEAAVQQQHAAGGAARRR
jgi:hypothetical protein